MEEIIVQETMKVLADWNPLGDDASDVSDLDNYRAEASDILFHIDIENADTVPKISTLIKNILNDAFDMFLTRDECKPIAKQIYEIAKKAKYI
ncbi:MAG: hypothetical protein A2086_05665 [Spirochaetes bacterium GWD1_27_9]|nr:MAG: hypothetical protein A2Y34_08700 [Spirochaetes bacterium GWC1_27_15]OHD37627.1 MAG: hypothetical protein A2086_05665 [Spirochaetes bacterium GWD1_27_9]